MSYARTALLVMDLQKEIVPMLGAAAPALLERTASVIAAARGAKLPVIYVVVGFRPGYPEVSPNNAGFAAAKASGRMEGVSAASIDERVKPQGTEPTVIKRRVNAFWGTDLDVILRAADVNHLILTGVSTSGVILSTTTYASDADYKLTIVKDCVMDSDEEVHRVLVEKILAKRAAMVTAAELVTALA
ncbi:MAG TPA: isochorismatase family cysteine hydrolase [Kofleriaceae bacterium]